MKINEQNHKLMSKHLTNLIIFQNIQFKDEYAESNHPENTQLITIQLLHYQNQTLKLCQFIKLIQTKKSMSITRKKSFIPSHCLLLMTTHTCLHCFINSPLSICLPSSVDDESSLAVVSFFSIYKRIELNTNERVNISVWVKSFSMPVIGEWRCFNFP